MDAIRIRDDVTQIQSLLVAAGGLTEVDHEPRGLVRCEPLEHHLALCIRCPGLEGQEHTEYEQTGDASHAIGIGHWPALACDGPHAQGKPALP